MNLVKIYQIPQTVFTRSSLAQIYPQLDGKQMTNALYYAVKHHKLRKIRRGFYVKPDYDTQELACMLYPPAYVSLDSVLFASGIIFQLMSEITCVSMVSRVVEVDGQVIRYKKLKDIVLTNPQGIINTEVKSVASVERAVLDTLSLDGMRYLDNLRPIHWEKIWELVPMYHNQALYERVKKMEHYAKDDK